MLHLPFSELYEQLYRVDKKRRTSGIFDNNKEPPQEILRDAMLAIGFRPEEYNTYSS